MWGKRNLAWLWCQGALPTDINNHALLTSAPEEMDSPWNPTGINAKPQTCGGQTPCSDAGWTLPVQGADLLVNWEKWLLPFPQGHVDSTASILGCPVEDRHHLTEGVQGRTKMVRAGVLALWAEAVRPGFVQPREGMVCGHLTVAPSACEGMACGHRKAVPRAYRMVIKKWTQAHCRDEGWESRK